MTNAEAVNWLINLTADIGKAEHRDLWHYEQALSEIKEMLESEPERKTGKWILRTADSGYHTDCICSECKSEHAIGWNFCPNCGADMRKKGEQDGN